LRIKNKFYFMDEPFDDILSEDDLDETLPKKPLLDPDEVDEESAVEDDDDELPE